MQGFLILRFEVQGLGFRAGSEGKVLSHVSEDSFICLWHGNV